MRLISTINKDIKNDLITIYNELKLGNTKSAMYWLSKYINDNDIIEL